MPYTASGTNTGDIHEPFPTCPFWFAPQHHAFPSAVSAHEWVNPVAIERMVPELATSTGVS
jgi:hypothetical protein